MNKHVTKARVFGSIDYRYVQTLPTHLRRKMPFIACGKMRDVDLGLLYGPRLGMSFHAACKEQHAFLYKKYIVLKDQNELEATANIRTPTSLFTKEYVYEAFKPFPKLPQTWLLHPGNLAEACIFV